MYTIVLSKLTSSIFQGKLLKIIKLKNENNKLKCQNFQKIKFFKLITSSIENIVCISGKLHYKLEGIKTS